MFAQQSLKCPECGESIAKKCFFYRWTAQCGNCSQYVTLSGDVKKGYHFGIKMGIFQGTFNIIAYLTIYFIMDLHETKGFYIFSQRENFFTYFFMFFYLLLPFSLFLDSRKLNLSEKLEKSEKELWIKDNKGVKKRVYFEIAAVIFLFYFWCLTSFL